MPSFGNEQSVIIKVMLRKKKHFQVPKNVSEKCIRQTVSGIL